MAAVKFFLVASWYMHLRTDQPVFRRFFIIGSVAAIGLYFVVLLTLTRSSRSDDGHAAAVDFPKWTPHPDVWLIVGAARRRATRSRSCASAPASRPAPARW